VAGLFAVSGTWRAVYWFAAAMMIVLALILRRALPRSEPETTGLTYVGLIASIIQLIAQEPLLRTRALLGAFSFAGFALMWTAISFLLAAPPFNYSDITIGLFGLAGAAGALAASKVGKLADKGEGDLTTWVGLGLLLASWLPLAYARSSPIVLIIGIVVLDLAAQVVQVSNQSAIYRIRPEARNRLNAAYMTIYFVGGSAGSLLSAHAYQRANWAGVVWVGIALATTGLIIWMFQHRQGAADAG
jgi:predicted MFS family arabinose efflux permease